MAREVAESSDLIRARSSFCDRKRLVSSAYIISLAGGRDRMEIPQIAFLRRIPMGSILKA